MDVDRHKTYIESKPLRFRTTPGNQSRNVVEAQGLSFSSLREQIEMRLFLDTEMTDLLNCELISIGIVSEDGREFYAERTDYDRSLCNDFVRKAVLPFLGREPAIVGTEVEIGGALQRWLAQFESIEVCVDHMTDWELFGYLVRDPHTLALPERITGRNIRTNVSAVDVEQYWRINGRNAHHALHDARANRHAFECSMKSATLEERLATFDPQKHGGEVMAFKPAGAEKH